MKPNITGVFDNFEKMTYAEKEEVFKRIGLFNEHGGLARRFRPDCQPAHVIFIDGFDYSGKTTFINALEGYLVSHRKSVKVLKFPSESLINDERQRQEKEGKFSYSNIALSEFRADIREAVVSAVSLNKYDYILCDRGPLSSFVYQTVLEKYKSETEKYDGNNRRSMAERFMGSRPNKELWFRKGINELETFFLDLEETCFPKQDASGNFDGAHVHNLIMSVSAHGCMLRRKDHNKSKDDMDVLDEDSFWEIGEVANWAYQNALKQLEFRRQVGENSLLTNSGVIKEDGEYKAHKDFLALSFMEEFR